MCERCENCGAELDEEDYHVEEGDEEYADDDDFHTDYLCLDCRKLERMPVQVLHLPIGIKTKGRQYCSEDCQFFRERINGTTGCRLYRKKLRESAYYGDVFRRCRQCVNAKALGA